MHNLSRSPDETSSYATDDEEAAKKQMQKLTAAQVLFAGIQVFIAAPNAAVPNVHYVYAAMNAAIGAAGAMAM